MLAIIWHVQNFCLVTDHKPLSFLVMDLYKNNNIFRWSLFFQEYDLYGEEDRQED